MSEKNTLPEWSIIAGADPEIWEAGGNSWIIGVFRHGRCLVSPLGSFIIEDRENEQEVEFSGCTAFPVNVAIRAAEGLIKALRGEG
jgi:hypothetical protein